MVGKQKRMSSSNKQISILTYCIFTILFSAYFLYIHSYLLSSIFLIYSVLFISIYKKKIKKSEKFESKFELYYNHYLLSLGFMITWLIQFIIDLQSFFAAYNELLYMLFAATTIVIISLYFKLFIKN